MPNSQRALTIVIFVNLMQMNRYTRALAHGRQNMHRELCANVCGGAFLAVPGICREFPHREMNENRLPLIVCRETVKWIFCATTTTAKFKYKHAAADSINRRRRCAALCWDACKRENAPQCTHKTNKCKINFSSLRRRRRLACANIICIKHKHKRK